MTAHKTIHIFALVAAGLLSLHAQAENYLVTNLDDSGPGSLRQAVLDANDNPGPDTIGFEGSLSGQIDLGDPLNVDEEVTISGSLRDPSRITIDGGGEDRIFTLDCDGDTVTIEGLTLTHGRTRASNRFGGAIYSEVCNLVLREMVITNNVASGAPRDERPEGYGGGVSVAGATLQVFDSTISHNVAGVDSDSVDESSGLGGGIAAIESHVEITGSVISDNAAINVNSDGIMGGGGVGALQSSLVIHRSTISGNTAGNRADVGDGKVEAIGGGVLLNCFLCPNGLRIDDSTISGNFAGNSGTGSLVAAWGGGVVAISPILVANSTISGNVVGDLSETSGAPAVGGGLVLFNNESSAIVASSTIAGNQALGASARGGGVAAEDGFVDVHNTIIAGNSAATGPDAEGSLGSFYSIIENQSDVVFTSGSAIAGSPELGPLADNGGPTETHAISNLSLAYNAGDPLECPAADQRGVERPQLGGCDIGAFELETIAAPITLTELFDELVENGDLRGAGSGRRVNTRLRTMRWMLVLAEGLVERERTRAACQQLSRVLSLTDGQPGPRDFVAGSGTTDLAAAIEEAQSDNCL